MFLDPWVPKNTLLAHKVGEKLDLFFQYMLYALQRELKSLQGFLM